MADKIKRLDKREHLLLRPGMYIGKTADETEPMWVLDGPKAVLRETTYNPGVLKLFDEIVLNATDQFQENPKLVKAIDVTVSPEGVCSVRNDGLGIPTGLHPEYQVHVPELIFTQFMTSSNYDDSKRRVKSGLNGLGAKITTTFSTLFTIDTVHKGTRYLQHVRDNNSVIDPPEITKSKSKDYTLITWRPDFARFKTDGMLPGTFEVLQRRSHDIAAITSGKVKVSFNGENLEVKGFKSYVDMFIPDGAKVVIHETPRWKVAVATADSFTQVSFVNGIATGSGGTHVKHVLDPVVKSIVATAQKKSKDVVVKPAFLKDNMFVMVMASIENPEFKSQAKEELTSKAKDFGSTFKFTDAHLKEISKLDMVSRMMDMVKFKESKVLSSTDGKKTSKITGIPKLDDAVFAGTKKSAQCTLILTEGDSAKTFAVSGVTPKDRDFIGIFPLKGKLLNVRDATKSQILKNQEITNLKTILGLQNAKTFKTTKDLKKSMRYGKVMVLTDSDVDGFHIKGLLLNFFHCFWPGLVVDESFVTCLRTPVVKATKGSKQVSFYTVPEYTTWAARHKGWKIKYYKGLGTSSSAEAKECFAQRDTKTLEYRATSDDCDRAVRLAFQKDLADNRKVWIQEKSGGNIVPVATEQKSMTVADFVDQELILFSIEDCERSIPSVVDGFKPSQRKVLYGTMLKNTNEEIKVDQLRGFVGEKTAYHHGDVSLNETIVNMAHDYVGSNNINFLTPCGQLGTRLMGGKDAASARYISVRLSPVSRAIFDGRDPLDHVVEDGQTIEPKVYYPVIPTVLVNGASGIGTGYSTDIPKHNPADLVAKILALLDDKPGPELVPWYKGFTGTVEKDDKGKWFTVGVWTRPERDMIRITELPIGRWTEDYKAFLETLIEQGLVTDVNDYKTDVTVNFEIHANPLDINDWIAEAKIEKMFKLRASVKSNLVLFDTRGVIKKYDSVDDILAEFMTARNGKYVERYGVIERDLADRLDVVARKIRFIELIMRNEITVFRETRARIVEQIAEHDLGDPEPLLNIKIHQFSQEQLDKLTADRDDLSLQVAEHKDKTPRCLWREDLARVSADL